MLGEKLRAKANISSLLDIPRVRTGGFSYHIGLCVCVCDVERKSEQRTGAESTLSKILCGFYFLIYFIHICNLNCISRYM